MKTSFLLNLAASKLILCEYIIQDDYAAEKFFDMFDMFTVTDPTDGFGKLYHMRPKLDVN